MTFDLNTLISTAVLAISAWTLKTVHEMAKTAAGAAEHARGQDAQLAETRTRLTTVETKVGALEVSVGRCQAQRDC